MPIFLRFVYVSDSFVKYVPHKMHTVSFCSVINGNIMVSCDIFTHISQCYVVGTEVIPWCHPHWYR